jgi:hypothetical protein
MQTYITLSPRQFVVNFKAPPVISTLAASAPAPKTRREKRAAREAKIEDRGMWNVWRAQGVPIMDTEALLYFTHRFLIEKAKENGGYAYDDSTRALDFARELAGGKFPPGSDVATRIVEFVKDRNKKHDERVRAGGRTDKTDFRDKHRAAIRDAVRALLLEIGMRSHQMENTDYTTSLLCFFADYSEAIMTYAPMRRGNKPLHFTFPMGWYTKLMKTGFVQTIAAIGERRGEAWVAVERTTTPQGEYVRLFRKKKGAHALYSVRGYLFINGKGERDLRITSTHRCDGK